jgi:hypothetical protein
VISPSHLKSSRVKNHGGRKIGLRLVDVTDPPVQFGFGTDFSGWAETPSRLNMRPFNWLLGTTGEIAFRNASIKLGIDPLEDRVVPAVIDLTARGAVGSLDGVFFTQYDARLGDTLQTRSFLRLDGPLLQSQPTQGYNTDSRPLQFDENSTATRSLSKDEVPAVNVGGVVYREIILDVSQLTLLTPRISLDQLRIYVGQTGDGYGYSATTKMIEDMSPVFDLDSQENSRVILDARLNVLGGADMRMYVPDAALTGGDYLYLYSKFGENLAPRAGTQTWSVFTSQAPAPPMIPPPPPSSPPPPPPALATIAGLVYADLNNNAQREDHESTLSDRVVYLDTDGDGQLDEGEPQATTDADGWYELTGLMAETTYTVRVVTAADEFASSFDVSLEEGEYYIVDIGVAGSSQT